MTIRLLGRSLLVLLAAWLTLLGYGASAADDFLDPDDAFVFSAETVAPGTLRLFWRIAPGYAMYRERLHLSALTPGAGLATPSMASGERKFDENFAKEVEVYHGSWEVILPVQSAAQQVELLVEYQGCADEGLCYSPLTRLVRADLSAVGAAVVTVDLPPAASAGPAPAEGKAATPATSPGKAPEPRAAADEGAAQDDGSLASRALQSGSVLQVAGAFLVFGLLLSFTPCVLPMVPILSSLLVGQQETSRVRGLGLATAYSLGMALVYTSLGVAAGLAGEGLAAWLQQPPVIAAFAILLLVISLSMFDVFTLQLPASLQSGLANASGRIRGGAGAGCFAMGALSALMVGPCVAAPLAGALLYISQTRDVWLGGFALFCMAAGMSVPLLLTGVSAGSLLPRAGTWMITVKHIFGLVLIGMAVWTASPLLPTEALMLAFGTLAVVAAIFLGILEPLPAKAGPGLRTLKAAAWLLALAGVMELVGVASGGRDALQPLGHLRSPVGTAFAAGVTAPAPAQFVKVASVAELDAALKASAKPVMLDFYADWCTACKEMEHFTFSDAQVAAHMSGFTLLQADVTANTEADRALLKRFQLFGPPGIVFFAPGGEELPGGRVIGYRPADAFLTHLQRMIGDARS